MVALLRKESKQRVDFSDTFKQNNKLEKRQ